MLQPKQFYHGTWKQFQPGDVVKPANAVGSWFKPTFAADTSRDHAYATEQEDTAWIYAQKAVDFKPIPHVPRVYAVEPLGEHEEDPRWDDAGRNRNIFDGDRRSTAGWRVVGERPMPEHLGTPEDWKS